VETGAALQLAAETTCKRLFTYVETLNSESEFANKPFDLLVMPRIARFHVSEWDFSAELFLQCKIVDRNGKVIYENTIPAKGQRGGSSFSPFAGFRGNSIIAQNSKEAFDMAFMFLANDIKKKVDFRTYIKP
jgi:hypothetical protein